MSKETGGSAFPIPIAGDSAGFVDAEECGAQTGMTLRDYAAIKAMQAMVSNHHIFDYTTDSQINYVVDGAYRLADAMLAARNK